MAKDLNCNKPELCDMPYSQCVSLETFLVRLNVVALPYM